MVFHLDWYWYCVWGCCFFSYSNYIRYSRVLLVYYYFTVHYICYYMCIVLTLYIYNQWLVIYRLYLLYIYVYVHCTYYILLISDYNPIILQYRDPPSTGFGRWCHHRHPGIWFCKGNMCLCFFANRFMASNISKPADHTLSSGVSTWHNVLA